MSGQPDPNQHPCDRETLLEIYRAQWADIHHTRDQDWEISRLILAGFLGLSGLTAFSGARLLIILLALGFTVISVLGIGVTLRHRRLFREKMAAIRILEKELKVDQLHLFKPPRSQRIFTTQNILIVVYVCSALVFEAFILSQRGP